MSAKKNSVYVFLPFVFIERIYKIDREFSFSFFVSF